MLTSIAAATRRGVILALAMTTALASVAIAAKIRRDTTPPTISFTAPPQTVVSGNAVSLGGTASDNVAVASVSLSVDGGAYQAAQGTTSWSYRLATTGLSIGSHTLRARAVDTSGNAATASATISVAADTVPPTISITSPASGATLTGTVTVAGQAADSVGVTKVAVRVDGGTYSTASGTTSWSMPINTGSLAPGAHTITAQATDAVGNTSTASETVTVADTTAPTVSIATPLNGATVSGAVTISGAASDNVAVASVSLSVDGGAYQVAQGTTSWSYALNTTQLADGSHTITARATDTSGNVSTASGTINVSNGLPPGIAQKMVTPEGATIEIATGVTGWTTQQVYDLLKANAQDLSLVGPTLTLIVQTQYATATTTGVAQVGGAYMNYTATTYLQATANSVFTTRPDYAVAHEYGHAWAQYYLYMLHGGDWSSYLSFRGIAGNALLNSSLSWDPSEMLADDYRMLFGSAAAVSESAYINPDIPDPRTVPGLSTFLISSWA